MQLRNKVVIITGASSGIGAAAAALFAEEGAKLVLGGRSQDRLDRVVEDIRARCREAEALAGDVQDEDYAKALVETALARYGRLDIGFNNAGALGAVGDVTSLAAEDWRVTLETNLVSAFYAAKHQVPPMRTQGRGALLFTSSFVGQGIGFPGLSAYGASKAGLVGLVQCLAVELGESGIRVNALLPGGTKTPMAGDFSDDPAAAEGIAQMHALKRMAEPEEIAKAALFLVSDAASFVTGSTMLADGGNSICKT